MMGVYRKDTRSVWIFNTSLIKGKYRCCDIGFDSEPKCSKTSKITKANK